MKYNTDLPARPILGYKILSEKTDISISALRTASHDGRLNLTRYRGPGNMVIFDADEVDARKGLILTKDFKPEVSLNIELADIHSAVQDVQGVLFEMLSERNGLLRILMLQRAEDSHELLTRLQSILSITSLAYIAAGLADEQAASGVNKDLLYRLASKDEVKRRAAWGEWVLRNAPIWGELVRMAAVQVSMSDLEFPEHQTSLLKETE